MIDLKKILIFLKYIRATFYRKQEEIFLATHQKKGFVLVVITMMIILKKMLINFLI